MASQDIFKSMHDKLLVDFISQDVENGFFDVVFDIGGKKLHAHKAILAAVSKPFGVMFADRWTTKDHSIELTHYSYDNYKELMTFVYSGSCKLSNQNIFDLLVMAESHDIAALKSFCDAFLAKYSFTAECVLPYIEIARRYSLIQLSATLKKFVSANFRAILGSETFIKCSKSVIEALVDYAGELGESKNEYCFSRVLEWAQKRAETKMNQSKSQNYNLQNGIKNELSGILSKFKFSKMRHLFLVEHVVTQSYLFSGQELNKILLSSRKIVVTITNGYKELLTSKIPYDREIFDVLSSIGKYSSGQFWNSMQQINLTKPCSLKKNNKIPFYLVIRNQFVCLLPPSCVSNTDYLIAEMKSDDDGFHIAGQLSMNVSTNF